MSDINARGQGPTATRTFFMAFTPAADPHGRLVEKYWKKTRRPQLSLQILTD